MKEFRQNRKEGDTDIKLHAASEGILWSRFFFKILRMLPCSLEGKEKAEYHGTVFYVKCFVCQNIRYNGDFKMVEI